MGNSVTEIRIYNSSIGKILPPIMNRGGLFTTKEKVTLLFRSIRGYKIFYIINSKKDICSYCFLKRGWLKKYPFMKKNDFLINPYYTVPKFRGQGYASKLIQSATGMGGYENIYALVKKDNYPSVSVLEKCGFHSIGYSGVKIWSHTVSQIESNVIIFRYSKCAE